MDNEYILYSFKVIKHLLLRCRGKNVQTSHSKLRDAPEFSCEAAAKHLGSAHRVLGEPRSTGLEFWYRPIDTLWVIRKYRAGHFCIPWYFMAPILSWIHREILANETTSLPKGIRSYDYRVSMQASTPQRYRGFHFVCSRRCDNDRHHDVNDM